MISHLLMVPHSRSEDMGKRRFTSNNVSIRTNSPLVTNSLFIPNSKTATNSSLNMVSRPKSNFMGKFHPNSPFTHPMANQFSRLVSRDRLHKANKFSKLASRVHLKAKPFPPLISHLTMLNNPMATVKLLNLIRDDQFLCQCLQLSLLYIPLTPFGFKFLIKPFVRFRFNINENCFPAIDVCKFRSLLPNFLHGE